MVAPREGLEGDTVTEAAAGAGDEPDGGWGGHWEGVAWVVCMWWLLVRRMGDI